MINLLPIVTNKQVCKKEKVKKSANAFFSIALFFSLCCTSFTANAQTGRALQFDGTDDYISQPLVINGDYTKEAWINTASLTAFPNILSGTGTALYLNNGRLAAGHSTGGFGQTLDPVSLTAGTWFHVAVTFNASTGDMKLYKNGLLVNSATSVAGYTETVLEIGRFAGANYFNGSIDEVRIWDTERSIAQINAGKDCELMGDEPGLLAYYNFNQGDAGGNNTGITTLLDSYDNCIFSNGTLINFALTGATSNWVAPGPVLTGTCSNSFANISVLGNSNCITLGDLTPSLIDHTHFGDYSILPITRTFTIQNTGNAVLNISSVVIGGTDASDFSVTAMPASTIAASGSTSFTVSFSPSGGTGIKNATITINNDDGDEGVFIYAISGNFAGPGKALAFDGFDDRIDLPFTFSGSYTKEAWIQTKSLSGFPNILSGNNSTGTALFLNNGQLAAGHGPAFTQVLDPVAISTGTWYHVAVTYDDITGVMNLYKNGVLVSTAGSVPAYTETLQQIGTFAGGNFFSGSIDEVRFWDFERKAADILATKDCELNGTEVGLIAYYNFNQGTQGSNNAGLTILNDLHGNCPLNGNLVNFTLNGTTSNWVAPGPTFTGSCTVQVANISVAGNSICIETGDISAVPADNTDFGAINNNTTTDRTFVITNNGGAVLTISNLSITGVDASSFSIVTVPAASVLPGYSTTFVIRFAPVSTGIKNAAIEIANNDADEATYNYAIKGESLFVTPVSLLYFKASSIGKLAKLIWETTAEINNAGFEIQRAVVNVTRWETIGYVNGTNNSTGSKYSFNDLAPLKGINAYRIKQVDFDGRNTISNVEVLNFSADETVVSVYPNPVIEKINLVFNDRKLLNSQAKISAASGAAVGIITLNNYRQQVDLAYLPKGLYFISFINGNVVRFIKQ
jgi:Concanavalin A-like lectin/glucanases superfamily/Secretion system C-terminal sorting domain